MEVAWTIAVVSGGMLKSGCNPGVPESLVFASVLFLILDLKGSES